VCSSDLVLLFSLPRKLLILPPGNQLAYSKADAQVLLVGLYFKD
jgi:hypothetical protein